MIIKGRYKKDDNFTTIYANNCIYTIARNSGEYACLRVGQCAYIGGELTQERYNELENKCTQEGTFEL